MESGHGTRSCSFRDGPEGEGRRRLRSPPRGVDEEVTADSSDLVASGTRGVRSEPTMSCSSCLMSYSGRQGAGAGPSSGAVRGADDGRDVRGGPRRGNDGGGVVAVDDELEEDGVGVGAAHRAGYVCSSGSDDEADSWKMRVTPPKTGRRRGGSNSNSSCVVELNRWDRPSSQPGYGCCGGGRGGFPRNNVASSAAAAPGAADRAETDRAFWEACLASGYP